MTSMCDQVKPFLIELQNEICHALSEIDPQFHWQEDAWLHGSGGGGITRAGTGGSVFEKGGVSFSQVSGDKLPPAASASRPQLAGKAFEAMGVSLVIHPGNPFVPTSHANFRFFMTKEVQPIWWFGGGYDLTPYYGFDADCQHWHQTAFQACEPFGEGLYTRFKRWCDDYFFIKHRNEPRGIGGLFFDDWQQGGFDHSFAMVQSIAKSFAQAYLPIVKRRQNHPYNQRHKAFQCYRRGRYVEFNLVYDRGTLFGLQSGGRTESILMSLPPQVNWQYNWQPEQGSEEAALYQKYLTPRTWVEEAMTES